VFDPRIAIPSSEASLQEDGAELAAVDMRKECIRGKCQICSLPYDDYAPQIRCKLCRMLILVCDSCQKSTIPSADGLLRCDICVARSRS
jgi:primosomal protein N'